MRLFLGGKALAAARFFKPRGAVEVAVGGQRQVERRQSFDVDERLRFPLAGATTARLGLAPHGGELATRLKVFSGAILLLANFLLTEGDHLIGLLRFERLAVRLVERVIEAGAVGL